MRRVAAVSLLLITTLLAMSAPALAGGGGNGVATACDGFAEGGHVALNDNCFDGTAHFVEPASTFIVANMGRVPHSYTAVDGTFDSGTVQPGDRTQLSVSEPGIYRVLCTLHAAEDGSGMTGVLVVGEPFTAQAASEGAGMASSGTAPAGTASAGSAGAGWVPLAIVGVLIAVSALMAGALALGAHRRRTTTSATTTTPVT